jgi:23S rRNA pseudoU1915 N3-methylase RlmH
VTICKSPSVSARSLRNRGELTCQSIYVFLLIFPVQTKPLSTDGKDSLGSDVQRHGEFQVVLAGLQGVLENVFHDVSTDVNLDLIRNAHQIAQMCILMQEDLFRSLNAALSSRS